MKTKWLALFFLFAWSTKSLFLEAASAAPKEVLDSTGKKLQIGVSYYIIPPPITENFGGLAFTSTGDKCKLDVVFVNSNQGLPMMFTPINPKKGVVHLSSDLNIMFSAESETNCTRSMVWKLDDYDASTGQWFVTTGGVVGNPGWQTVQNWFKIENYDGNYKLVYCPSVCKHCRVQCRDIGMYEDKYGKRLALSDVPYKFQFQLA